MQANRHGLLFSSGRRVNGRRILRGAAAAGAGTLLVLSCLLFAGVQAASANSGPITANGSPVTATISSAGIPATFTFTGTSGEVVTASAYDGTFAGSCDVDLEILTPSSTNIASVGCVGTSGFIGETPLPGAGTYTLELVPTDSDLGSVTLALSANPANGTITVNGPSVSFTATNTGQGQEFTFTGGKNGQTVTLSASGGTFPNGCDENMYLLTSS
ncbi:MAG: hypothetical protein ACLP6E_12900, partial [Acidimicrobiales bacterium]